MTLLGGVVTGMIVGDAMGAVATKATVPATSNSATAKATGDGTPVGKTTARQSLYHSGLIVVAAVGVLLLGSKFLKDARIG